MLSNYLFNRLESEYIFNQKKYEQIFTKLYEHDFEDEIERISLEVKYECLKFIRLKFLNLKQ
jgi:hypothetical protein